MTRRGSPSSVERVTLPVFGVSCISCIRHIRKALDEVSGVESADVNLARREVTVLFDPETTGVDGIVSAIQRSGYAVEAPKALE